ncbi:MAG: DNA repair protein RadC [Saprospiraceae bacterium]|nr:DNA repair protein RadC [Saprospiraceae bacterium]
MHEKYPLHLPIKCWAEDDRPREKLIRKGKAALSDAELLAILLGSGTKTHDALSLAKLTLQSCQFNLIELSKMDHFRLGKIHGLGPAKSLLIEAALELGRRRQHAEALEKKQLLSSKDAYLLIKAKMEDLTHEEFWVLFLSRSNKLLAIENFSKGGLTGTVADSRLIFQRALDWKCTGLILAHNHPSGALKPSQQDIDLTRKMKAAGQQLELNVLDHLIVTEDKYFSFADEGML